MEYLWSPWRMEYIQSHTNDAHCIFCLALEKTDGIENLIVFRGQRVFVMLNRYPYTSGHLMVVPNLHQPSLENIDLNTGTDLFGLTQKSIQVLKKTYQPQGFNIGVNIGEASGAGITGHVHMHVVPRWRGDTNFMSTLAITRVLPESLEETYCRLKENWECE